MSELKNQSEEVHVQEQLFNFEEFKEASQKIKQSLIVLCILLFGFIITMKLTCN